MTKPERREIAEGVTDYNPAPLSLPDTITTEENPYLLLFEEKLSKLGFRKQTLALLKDCPDGLCISVKRPIQLLSLSLFLLLQHGHTDLP